MSDIIFPGQTKIFMLNSFITKLFVEQLHRSLILTKRRNVTFKRENQDQCLAGLVERNCNMLQAVTGAERFTINISTNFSLSNVSYAR